MRPRVELKTGFTLIELLVTIGIIAILASLLLTGISLASRKAKRVTCMNNLRQINLGVRMYADDSNDKSPGKVAGERLVFTGYKEIMKNYVGLRGASSPRDRLFSCPAVLLDLHLEKGVPAPVMRDTCRKVGALNQTATLRATCLMPATCLVAPAGAPCLALPACP